MFTSNGFIEQEEMEFLVLYYLVAREFNMNNIFLISLYTLLSCVMKTVQSCGYVGLSGIALQSKSSNSIVLIPHRHAGNLLQAD